MSNDRIIIAKDGIKREVTFPFEICLSREAARWLRDQLRQMDHDESTYGWITISHPIDSQGKANTPPLRWTDTHSHGVEKERANGLDRATGLGPY